MIQKFNLFEGKHDKEDPYGEENWDDEPPKLPYHYDTKLEIGRPLQVPRHENIYKINVENMHGDGDAYTTRTLYEQDKNEVIKIIDFLKWIKEYRNGRRNEREIRRVAEQVFGSEDLIYELIDGDVTCDHQYLCNVTGFRVTYFDEDGIEKRVLIDGR